MGYDKSKGPIFTGWFLVIWVTVFLVWELFALGYYGAEATISYVMIDWSTHYPVLALGIGVLMGHFFWQLNRK